MNERDLIKLLSNLQGNQKLAVEEFLFLFIEIASEGFSGETSFVINWLNGNVGTFDYIEKKKLLKAERPNRRIRSRGLDN